MIDQDVAADSASSVYRVLSGAGLLDRWNPKPSKKGTGFVQPVRPHEPWHIDVAYLNLGGTFYYLCSVLDGASRAIVHWEIREAKERAYRQASRSSDPDRTLTVERREPSHARRAFAQHEPRHACVAG
jgi:transposase InsO family protein